LASTAISHAIKQLGLTAKSGGGQTTAVPLTSMINQVTTVAAIGDSVKLPGARPSLVGVEILAINDARQRHAVFCSSNDTIQRRCGGHRRRQMGGSAVYYVLKSYNPTTNVGTWVANGIGAGLCLWLPDLLTQTGVVASATQTSGCGYSDHRKPGSDRHMRRHGKTPALCRQRSRAWENHHHQQRRAVANIFPASSDKADSRRRQDQHRSADAAFVLVITTPTDLLTASSRGRGSPSEGLR